VIDIAMIPVTDEPMEGVALMCKTMPDEQVLFWTSTHGEMISSDLHGAEEPIKWMLRPHQGGRDKTKMDQGLCTREEENVPPEALWQSLT
jgi:hypothetical protein